MGRPRKWASDAERKRAERAGPSRQSPDATQAPTEEAVVPGSREPVPDPEPKYDTRPTTFQDLCRAARAGTIELTETEEQFIRDFLGYAASEKRGLLERDATAQRIASRTPSPPPGSTVVRKDEHGKEVGEEVGPAGLSLVAFPVQTPGDLTPTAEEKAKLG